MRCFGIGVCLVLLCSCLSFDIGDWPSGFAYPHNNPTTNWCGSIGAFCAYYLLYYIGPGVFVVLASAICYLGAQLAQRPTNQPVLRATGLALVTVAASITFQYFWPHRIFTFPSGSGGVLGVGAAQLLRSHFAVLGTFILVAALWTVGAILLADGLILLILRVFAFVACKFVGVAIPAWAAAKQHSQVLNEIWRELSARQKPLAPVTEPSKPVARTEPARVRPGSDVPRPVDGIPVRTQSAVVPEKPDRPQSSLPAPAVVPCCQEYQLPPLDLLAEPEYGFASVQEKVVKAKASALEKLLSEFNINARVVAADSGPVVTMFELELAAGVKVSQIASLANDMARALGVGAVRVVAPLPGKHTIGIEVPNSEKERVRIKNLMQLAGAKPQKMQIPLYLGKDSSGEALVSDLTKMPHLLIAGTTGSGKSVCINSVITGVLLTKRPDEVKMILIDPKMVEMTAFNTIPHLMCPIVTETQMAVQILEWATVKMDERYALLAEARVKNIAEFNALDAEEIIRRFDPTS
jgi:S-DNA-T family DNA segregation ATPase FtsK/SpoIIIE